MTMPETPQTIEEWINSCIAYSREAISRSRASGGPKVSNLDDFSEPCQVHLFWFRAEPDVDLSLLVRTRMVNFPDGFVEVIGPIHPADAEETLLRVLADSKWDVRVEDPSYVLPLMLQHQPTLRNLLADALGSTIQRLKQHITRRAFSKTQLPTLVQQMALPGNGFTWEIWGDPRTLRPEEVMKSAQTPAVTGETPRRERRSEPERLSGFGTYFYPPVWVGEVPVPSLLDRLRREESRLPSAAWDTVVSCEYKGKVIIVTRDGFLFVPSTSRTECVDILNEIMATCWLAGVQARPVREYELATAQVDTHDKKLVQKQESKVSIRSAQGFDQYPGQGALLIDLTHQKASPEQIEKLVALSEELSADSYLRNTILFLFEAYGHFVVSENRQAVVMAWLVAEAWLQRQWSKLLEVKNVSRTREERLTKSNPWTAEVISETLNLLGMLDDAGLTDMNTIRRLRNRVVHDGYDPSKEEASQAIQLARKLTLLELRPSQKITKTT